MAAEREKVFDLFKGICILAVMLIHSTNHSARHYADPDSVNWWILTILNRIMTFAVPAFLFISALLLARSLSKGAKPDWKRFYARRVMSTLYPFLVWTVIFVVFRLLVFRAPYDISEATFEWPFGTLTGPVLISDPKSWTNLLLWGRAYFHLYFLSVLLKTIILFPIFYWIAARRISVYQAIVLAFFLQAAWLVLETNLFKFRNPASIPGTYLAAILIGGWLGAHWQEASKDLASIKTGAALSATLSGAVYIGISVGLIKGLPHASLFHGLAFALYSTSVALLVLWASQSWGPSRMRPWIISAGSASIVLYLAHPIALYYLSGPTIRRLVNATHVAPVVSFVLLLIATCVLLTIIKTLRLDRLLFGQKLVSPEA